MKKWVIGSLVGAILVFAWQASSWMALGIHNGCEKYTPAQDTILSTLSSTLKEDGMYMMPNVPPGSDSKTREDAMKKAQGKPMAAIVYLGNNQTNMTTSMIYGFITDLLLVVLLISIMVRGGMPNFIGIFTGCIAVGLFTFLWGPFTAHVWFQYPWSAIKGDLIDALVAWGLCGLWLAWWLRR